ncbi:hypothetical protein R3P38DRAFT_3376982 [Favolaschia claudopus]|uniref:F-box domain-containing protein n=1 Tax=Favolaschia claudopus TaxID=2862362 RepID=A0AAV9ZCJ3_9AGAR
MESDSPPSFLQVLLQSNQSPLDSQIPAIRDLIATTEAQLAALSSEREGFRRKDEEFLQQLAPLEKQISDIQKKRRTLQRKANDLDATMRVVEKRIRAQNSILSPIRRLPPELLCEIFQWAMLHGFTRRILRWKVAIAPWRLTHVCQAWRDAARACPRLWSTIEIDVPNGFESVVTQFLGDSDTNTEDSDAETDDSESWPGQPRHSLSMYFPKAGLDTQLHLAYPAPLDIIFNVGRFKKSSYLCELLRRLVCRSNRWARLTLNWTYDSETFSVLAGIKGQIASLRSLQLGLRGSDYWPSIFADIFSVAPRLRRVEATILAEISPSQFLLPQHQLTHLRLCTRSRRTLDILLPLADTLTHADLAVDEAESSSDAEDEFESESFPDAVELSKLQWLSLDNDSGMGCLIAPQLDSLKITGYAVNVHTILNRSKGQLKSLSFNGAATPKVLDSLVQRAHILAHLWVRFPLDEEGKSLLSALIRSVSDGVCPNLCLLEVDYSPFCSPRSKGEDTDFEMICDTVESCWNVAKDTRTLRSVRFPMSNCPLPILERFDRMRLEGLNVTEGSTIQSDEGF